VRPYFKKTKNKKLQVNESIRVSPVRLIDENGKNLGIVSLNQALNIAKEKGLDLVEVAPHIKPPVCKIMDYGKYLYEQRKKQRKKKKDTIKGIRIGLRTAVHDINTKVKQAQKFLEKGYKVKIEVRLKGREKIHKNLANEKLKEFLDLIPVEYVIFQEAKSQPSGVNIIIKRK